MRARQTILYSLTGLTAAAVAGSEVNPLRVLTYNVRYDSMPDDITVRETIDSLNRSLPQDPPAYYANLTEQPWSTRRIHVSNDILLGDVDIYGGQELLVRQVHDVQELLGDQFAWIGVGRDDGKRKGEYAAIFYNQGRIQLRDWDTFWLSETPFDVSKYPGAGSYRVATAAHFTGHVGNFTVINTHLDDQSDDQRRLGASLVLYRAQYEIATTGRPVIVTGDFNSPTSDGAYQIMTGTHPMVSINKTFADRYSRNASSTQPDANLVMKDLLGESPPRRRSGHHATFSDFAPVGDFSQFERLDYIFANSHGGWKAEAYHVGENLYDDGIYASDHRPVYARLLVQVDNSLNLQP